MTHSHNTTRQARTIEAYMSTTVLETVSNSIASLFKVSCVSVGEWITFKNCKCLCQGDRSQSL